MGKSFRERHSDNQQEEVVKRMNRMRYRIGNYRNLLRPCACGAHRAYEDDGEVICLNCQDVQPKENVLWG